MMYIGDELTGRSSWRFADRIPGVPPESFRLPGIPETPVEHHVIPGVGTCLFKMEQECPTGSHKDRAAVFQVSTARSRNVSGIVIPSSGNAAIAVAAAGAHAHLPVYAFLSPDTHKGKLAALVRYRPHLIICRQPVNRARNIARRFHLPNLRPSRDDNAVKGFMTLGYALGELCLIHPFSSIFVFTTSGATLTGIARALLDLFHIGRLPFLPRLHAVQSGKATGLAARFDSSPVPATVVNGHSPGFGGVADSRLYPELLASIEQTRGSAWFASCSDAAAMKQVLVSAGIHTSPEGCCALAAAARWRIAGGTGTPLIVLTGKDYPDPVTDPDLSGCAVCCSETYRDIEKCIRQWRNT